MSAARYVPVIFAVVAVILSLYASYEAINAEFPPTWGWAFAPFAWAVFGITIIGLVQSIPRALPSKEVIPILRTGIRIGAIIKVFFIVASFIQGAYIYWIYPPDFPGAPVGLGWEGAGGIWLGVTLALAVATIGDIVAHAGLGMMLKHGGKE